MGEKTGISWAHHTKNKWLGCTRVGPGCGLAHPTAGEGGGCYAEAASKRYGQDLWGDDKPRVLVQSFRADVRKWNRKAEEARERRRLFVNSFSDILDHRAEQSWRNEIIEDAWACPWLDFLLLTKRIGNAAKMLPAELPPNVWMGITCVDQDELDRDWRKLSPIRALHWISHEPALGRIVRLPSFGCDWVVTGGESGHHPRPYDVDWARDLIDQGRHAAVPIFVKQMGSNPVDGPEALKFTGKGDDPAEWPEDLRVQQFPTARAA